MPEVLFVDGVDPPKAPELEEYYHGYIDRTEAERRLKAQGIPNSYLLRLGRTFLEKDTWNSIYILSYLSSTLECYHFKLIPRFNCFQLGGRLFDCLQGCLSRYHVHDIMNGERLRYPVPPCAPPVEFHKQRLRAVQSFEPETASDRLGCSIDDRFLLVSDDQNTDWVFVISVKTRQSGYLPKCCVEKEYPELIERLEFFHPDASSSQSKELLKKAGAYSYLLRPCDSKPGLYTLLFYDGTRVRKYRLELHVHSEELPGGSFQRETQMSDLFCGVNHRRSSEPIGSSTSKSEGTRGVITGQEHIPVIEVSRHRSGGAIVPGRQDSLVPPPLSSQHPMVSVFPRYRTVTRVMYNGLPFPSVEAVVTAIVAHPGPWHPESPPDVDPPNGAAALLEEQRRALPDFDEHFHSPHAQNAEGDWTRLTGVVQQTFKPIRRERKPQIAPPSSTIYMALRYTRQPVSHSSVLEIHGEISMLMSQRKKWKPFYAQLDGKQGILTLRDIDKRKFERFDLSRSDYFPVHHLMYDRPFCFGLLLHGSSVGDREELVFSVDPPSSPCSVCFPSTTSTTNSIGASNCSAARPQHSSSPCDLDPSTYAGRLDDADASPTTSLAHSSGSHQTFDPSVRLSPTQCTVGFGTDASGTACSHRQVVPMDTIFTRWQRFIRLHCRNTRVDSANEENFDRRQTLLRCYRTLDVKVHNAKLLPANWCKSRRDESTFWLMIDGVEIARAYAGSSTVSILIDDFPYGFKKVELYAREENKRKRFVALEVDLSQLDSDTSLLSDSSAYGIQRVELDKDPHGVESNLSSKSSICHVREGCCAQGTITYKELHVLPFTCYERFREVIRTCLDSEFVPLCIYTWKNLQNELSNKPNFVSSLLLTTTELRCHLQLIVHLLESDIMPDNPNDSFRGNTLGTQILDHYCNIVCADWRYNCFKRVREDALNGLPLSCSSDSSTTSLQSANFYCAGDRPSVPLSTQRPSVPNTRCTPNTSTGRPHSLSAGASTNSTIFGVTDVQPQTGLSIATCHQSGSPSQQQQPIALPMLEQEWHSRLISIAIEDLTSHVNQFPLQVRWVYSELQALHSDQLSNSVIRNLVFLRGICPCLFSAPNTTRGSISTSLSAGANFSALSGLNQPSFGGLTDVNSSVLSSWSCGSQASIGGTQTAVSNDALVLVAKTLMSLVSSNPISKAHSDGILSPEQFMDYHQKVFKQFIVPITAPLSTVEIKQLEKLYEREACVVSCRSLSRELAQLANCFLDALGPRNLDATTGTTSSTGTDHRQTMADTDIHSRTPSLWAALCELDDKTNQYLNASSTELARGLRR